jgi:hypothetical protein
MTDQDKALRLLRDQLDHIQRVLEAWADFRCEDREFSYAVRRLAEECRDVLRQTRQ